MNTNKHTELANHAWSVASLADGAQPERILEAELQEVLGEVTE